MSFFTNPNNPYPRSRKSVYAKYGIVGTSQPLAAQAGLRVLQQGGNAVDAAIATAACLTVVEPTTNGIGSDAFAIISINGQQYGINGSGPAPQSLKVADLQAAGLTEMPKFGWTSIDVPGAPAAWAAMVERFGQLSLAEDLAPAITYACDGYPVSQTIAYFWERAAQNYRQAQKEATNPAIFDEWFKTFCPNGHAPRTGEVWQSAEQADTLTRIGQTQARDFYEGTLAKKIVAAAAQNGGYLTAEDLAAYQPAWVTPLKLHYHGYDVLELPPNSQGVVALEALGLLQGWHFTNRDSFDTVHHQIEAIKLAFADFFKFAGDPQAMQLNPNQLLASDYLASRSALIGESARPPEAGDPQSGGTVYLATADRDGNMVSMIQSNYMGFGSGVVVPGTGIALNNRGNNFSFDPASPNVLEGGKRPINTIIPGFLTKNGTPIGPFGVMGGFMQPQGHLQVLMNTIDFGLDPQAALDAPRWQWMHDQTVQVEREVPAVTVNRLVAAGHHIVVQSEPNVFGRGQVIWRNPETQTYVGGSESRTDGAMAVW
ncbi:gamma-glutamyltransferase family protein [Lacticaseibacillus styriensis]|uniref:Gamma-glutamyltransferase n=2 Tax=Lacticaseibacillus TaxID=2759736 RepID=A0AAN1EXN6_LACCA|nr:MULTISPECIES: gamma-glutamyltransferase family protein [Lacticaseibacillus]ARY90388.1 gamma-glutamyltransferase [Lacticaseibacillus casei]WLV81008.1 gamma-glutamyltransferase family protein [Lacticaseibacillus sp. NCIMB 15473]WNX27738.1 gamma-glutamyltransferase family protein [Lacticaseibacillus casei]